MIDGWLKSDGAGLEDRIVAVNVNGSCVDAPLTDGSGYFSCTRDFSLGDAYNTSTTATATYTITASYDGGQPLTATAYANTLDGKSYAQCTTIQYGHKPSSNSTVLTVTPQSALATTSTNTTEQMKKEVEDGGWLTVWHEWSWWYPWYRMHSRCSAVEHCPLCPLPSDIRLLLAAFIPLVAFLLYRHFLHNVLGLSLVLGGGPNGAISCGCFLQQ